MKRPLLSLALVLCWVTLSGAACRRSTLPPELSDKDYWALIESLSEPAGTFTLSDNLVSNEPGVAENVRKLEPVRRCLHRRRARTELQLRRAAAPGDGLHRRYPA